MEEDMAILMEPLVDAISNVVAGDHFVDMANPAAVESMNSVLTAVEQINGIARSIGAVTGGKLNQIYQEICDEIQAASTKAQNAMTKLQSMVKQGDDPRQLFEYKNEFIPALQVIVEYVGRLLHIHAQQFVIRVNQHGFDAKTCIKEVEKIALSKPSDVGNGSPLIENAKNGKMAIIKLSKTANEAAENTDNDVRIKMIRDAQDDVKNLLPEFLTKVQSFCSDTSNPDRLHDLHIAVRNAVGAVNDVIIAVTMAFRKNPTLSLRTERYIMEATDDLADALDHFHDKSDADAATKLMNQAKTTIQVLTAAAEESSDPAQKEELLKQAENIRADVQKAIIEAKNKVNDPTAFDNANNKVMNDVVAARGAVNGKEGWGLSPETEQRVNDTTKAAALADKVVADKASPENQKALDNAIKDTVNAVNDAAKESRDPRQREQLKSIANTIAAAAPIVNAANANAQGKPTDPIAQANAAKANDDLLTSLRDARTVTSGKPDAPVSDDVRQKVKDDIQKVQKAADKTNDDLQAGASPDKIAEDAKDLGKVGGAVAKNLKDAAEHINDPAQKVRMMQAADAMQAEALALGNAAMDASKRPNDAGAAAQVAKASDALDRTMKKALAAVDKDPAASDALAKKEIADKKSDALAQNVIDATGAAAIADKNLADENTPKNADDLAKKNKDVVEALNKFADSVAPAASGGNKPTDGAGNNEPLRQRVLDSAKDVENKHADVAKAADAARKNPSDPLAQANFKKANDDYLDALQDAQNAVLPTGGNNNRSGPGGNDAGDKEADDLSGNPGGKDGARAADGSAPANDFGDPVKAAEGADKRAKAAAAAAAVIPVADKVASDAPNKNTSSVPEVKKKADEAAKALNEAAKATNDPVQKIRMMEASDALVPASNKLAEAAAAVAANPTDKNAQDNLKNAHDDVVRAAKKGAAAAAGNDVDGDTLAKKDVDKIADAIDNAIASVAAAENKIQEAGNPTNSSPASAADLKKDVAKANDDVKKAVDAIHAAAADPSVQPKQREDLMAAAAGIAAAAPPFAAAGDSVANDVKNPQKQQESAKKADDLIEKLKEAKDKVADSDNQQKQLDTDALNAVDDLAGGANSLVDAVAPSPKKNLDETLKDLGNKARDVDNMVTDAVSNPPLSKPDQKAVIGKLDGSKEDAVAAIAAVAAAEPNADKKKKLAAAGDNLKNKVDALEKAAEKTSGNPTNPEGAKVVADAKKDVDKAIDQVRDAMNPVSAPTEKEILAATDAVAAAVAAAMQPEDPAKQKAKSADQVKKDVDDLNNKVGDLDKALTKAIAEAAKNNDPVAKKNLEDAQKELKPAVEEFKKATNDSVGKSPDAQIPPRDKVLDVLGDIRKAVDPNAAPTSAPADATPAAKAAAAAAANEPTGISDATRDKVLAATAKEAADGHRGADAAKNGDKPKADALKNKLADDTNAVVAAGMGAAAEAPVGSERDRVIDAVNDVKDASKALQDAIGKAAANPNNPQAQAELAKADDKHDEALDKLRDAVTHGNAQGEGAAKLADAVKDVLKKVDDLDRAARAGNAVTPAADYEKKKKDAVDAGDKVIDALHGQAASAPSEKEKQNLMDAAKEVEKLVNGVDPVANKNVEGEIPVVADKLKENPKDEKLSGSMRKDKKNLQDVLSPYGDNYDFKGSSLPSNLPGGNEENGAGNDKNSPSTRSAKSKSPFNLNGDGDGDSFSTRFPRSDHVGPRDDKEAVEDPLQELAKSAAAVDDLKHDNVSKPNSVPKEATDAAIKKLGDDGRDANNAILDAVINQPDPGKKEKLAAAGENLKNKVDALEKIAATAPNTADGEKQVNKAKDDVDKAIADVRDAMNPVSAPTEKEILAATDAVAAAVAAAMQPEDPAKQKAKSADQVKKDLADLNNKVADLDKALTKAIAEADKKDPKAKEALQDAQKKLKPSVQKFEATTNQSIGKAPTQQIPPRDEVLDVLGDIRKAVEGHPANPNAAAPVAAAGSASNPSAKAPVAPFGVSQEAVDRVNAAADQQIAAGDKLEDALKNPASVDPERLDELLKDLADAAKETNAAANGAAAEAPKGAERDAILAAAALANDSAKALDDAAKRVAKNPLDPAAKKNLADAADKHRDNLKILKNAVDPKKNALGGNKAPGITLVKGVPNPNAHNNSGTTPEDWRNKKLRTTAGALGNVDDKANDAADQLKKAAERAPNPAAKANQEALADLIQAKTDVLADKAKDVAKAPNDPKAKKALEAAKKDLQKTIDDAKDSIKDGQTGYSDPLNDGILNATDKAAAAAIEAMKRNKDNAAKKPIDKKAPTNDQIAKKLVAAGDDVDKWMSKQIEAAKEPSWKKELEKARSKVLPAVQKLADITASGQPGADADKAADDVFEALRQARAAANRPGADASKNKSPISDKAKERLKNAIGNQLQAGHDLAQKGGNNDPDALRDLEKAKEATTLAAIGAALEAPKDGNGKDVPKRDAILDAAAKNATGAENLGAAGENANLGGNGFVPPQEKKALEDALKKHDDALHDLAHSVDPSGKDKDKSIPEKDAVNQAIKDAAEEIRNAMNVMEKQMTNAAMVGGSAPFASKQFADTANKAINSLIDFGMDTDDEIQRQKLLAAALRMKNAALGINLSGGKPKPSDIEALINELDQVEDVYTLDLTDPRNILHAVGPNNANVAGILERGADATKANSADLVALAALNVKQAQELCEVARALAAKENDPTKKRSILDAANKTQESANKVLQAMQVAVEKPQDQDASAKLDNAYSELSKNVKDMISKCGLTEEEMRDSGLKAAIEQMDTASKIKDDVKENGGKGAVNTSAGQAAADFLTNNVIKNPPKEPKQYVKLAIDANLSLEEFLKQLDAFIATCDDPVYKEQLKKQRRTLKDKSIQMKILATTKANSANLEEAQEAISAAAKGITAGINEAMNLMQAASIRLRFKKALNTAVAMNKAVKGFKGMLKKREKDAK